MKSTQEKIKQAPILVTKDNLTEIKNVNQEFNYHGGLSEAELELLKKMVSDNVEMTGEVNTKCDDLSTTTSEQHADLHLKMENNKKSIQ